MEILIQKLIQTQNGNPSIHQLHLKRSIFILSNYTKEFLNYHLLCHSQWSTLPHLPLPSFLVHSVSSPPPTFYRRLHHHLLVLFLLSSLFQRTPSLCFLASLLALFLTGKNQWWHIPLLLSHCLSSGSGCFVMLDHHISDRYKVNCFSHLSATGSPTLCKLSIYLVCILSCFKGCEFCAIF